MLQRLHDMLDGSVSRWLPLTIQSLIVLNVAAVVVETIEPLGSRYRDAFGAFEALSVAVFTVEYLARLVAAVAEPKFMAPILGRLRYALTPLALVDRGKAETHVPHLPPDLEPDHLIVFSLFSIFYFVRA